jgi:putative transposase
VEFGPEFLLGEADNHTATRPPPSYFSWIRTSRGLRHRTSSDESEASTRVSPLRICAMPASGDVLSLPRSDALSSDKLASRYQAESDARPAIGGTLCHDGGTMSWQSICMGSRFVGQLRWLQKVRLYPTCAQERALLEMLGVTRELYNALLQQRRDAWITHRSKVTSCEQYRQLTELRANDARFAAVYRDTEDAVLHRLDLAFAAFFRRMKRRDTPGYPRFKSATRWNQLEFSHGDRAMKLNASGRRVRIPGVGSVRLRKGRLVGEFGRAFIVVKNGRWYATFESHREVVPLPPTGQSVGIDRGIHVLAMLSDGTAIPNVRPGSSRRALVERHQRALDAATEKDSAGRVRNGRDPARKAAVRRMARAKEREANARRDWLHKVSRAIVRRFDRVVLEALNLCSMTRSAKGTLGAPGTNVRAKAGLNRALLDAGFGMLGTLIREKAAHAARVVVEVDARYSSQTCASCGHVARESRKGRRFACLRCGHTADADVNAARVLLLRAESPPTRAPSTARGGQDAA